MIGTELEKLGNAKTLIRKSIQRKGTGLTTEEIFPAYYTYIEAMTDIKSPDEDGLKDYAEDRCYSLEIHVKKIRPYAFRGYTCLQELYLNSSSVVILENINAFYNHVPTILVPSNLMSQYLVAENWNKIADKIKPYNSRTVDEMYLNQHIDCVQPLSWMNTKKVGEFAKDFR